MKRLSLLWLGVRLSNGHHVAARVRWATATIAIAAATVVVLSVSALPGAAQHRADRAAARTSQQPGPGQTGLLLLERQTTTGSGSAKAWLVAAPPGSDTTPPPGISHLPKPGTSMVSPALARFLRSDDGAPVRAQFGKIAGMISPTGLVDPAEMYAYVGVRPGQLHVFGDNTDPQLLPEVFARSKSGPSVTAWTWTAGLLALLVGPLSAIVVSAVRLSEISERRQLSTLRLLGLTSRQLQLIRLGTIGPGAVGGLTLGVALFELGSGALSRFGLAGRSWNDGDITLSSAGSIGVAVVATVALTAGRRVARDAAAHPWLTRRGRPPRPRSAWTLAPLAAAIAVLVGVVVLGKKAYVLDELAFSSGLVPLHLAGLSLAIVGVLVAAPTVVELFTRHVGDRTRSTTLHLASRIGGADGSGPARWGALLCAAVLLGSLGISFGRAVIEPFHYLDNAPVSGIIVDQSSNSSALHALERWRPQAVAAGWTVQPDGGAPGLLLVANCADLLRVEPRISGCRRGTASYQLPGFPGGRVPFTLGGIAHTAPMPTATLSITAGADYEIAGSHTHQLIDISVVAVPRQNVAPSFIMVALHNEADRRTALGLIAANDPTASINDSASARAQFRSTHAVDDRVAANLVSMMWGLLALGLLISLVDRCLSAAQAQSPLVAVGAPEALRARVLAIAALMPVAALLPVAAFLSGLADLSWSRVIYRPLAFSPIGPVLAVTTGGVAALVVVAISTVLAKKASQSTWRRE